MRDVCVGSLSLVVPVIFQEEVNCGFDGVKEGCLPLCGVSSWRFSSFLLVVCAVSTTISVPVRWAIVGCAQ